MHHHYTKPNNTNGDRSFSVMVVNMVLVW